MAKRILKTFSNIKVKRFFFFLGLASILWILTKFGKEFTSSMTAKISYKNIPETAALADNNPQEIKFDITANGFEVLFFKLKKPVLEIDVEEFYIENKNKFAVSRQDLILGLDGNFNKSMEIKNFNPDPLEVDLEPIVLKKVVVAAKTDIDYKNGFRAIGDYQLDPKMITISGPKAKLESIDTVFTEKLSLKKVDRNISEKVALKSPSSDVVSMEPSEVQLNWEVAEFSEGKFTLPVEVINLPPGRDLKLVPQQVSVTFLTAVNQFSEISTDNFRVVCDYSKRNEEESFMTPQLVKKPNNVVNIVVEPKKVEYLVFKK